MESIGTGSAPFGAPASISITAQSIQSLLAPGSRGWMRDPDVFVIACTSFPAQFKGLDGNPHALVLHFDDIEDPSFPSAFTPGLAHRIRSFLESTVDAHGGRVRLICACDGGVSRSVAVSAACMRRYGQEDGASWALRSGRPNRLVHRLLLEEFGLV